ncbi:hypothetical protein KP79_PYT25425 [Mizuhopecten yessoensis]|uniref:Uncharacterized protein n=1 Tax=Mizuhopecten yessoensis TaxID=6573 RepID=A0A210QZU7_MIZYE|nr:hypothetical protein KP79_PYT25425 [Mizuhopecten yessoensis]
MLEGSNQSAFTKRNTIWGLKIFQGTEFDLESVSEEDLADVLAKFYCDNIPAHQAEEFHRNTLIKIRGAVNRHLVDIVRNIDIVRGVNFKNANRTLDGLLKERTRTGVALQTAHKEIISPLHVTQISTYLQGGYFPLTSSDRTGLEFHEQLRVDSFEVISDEQGMYATINHNTKQNKYQGRFSSSQAPTKRMCATGSLHCPVAMLQWLISKTDSAADKRVTCKPLAKRTYNNFMADMCKSANISKKIHCTCTSGPQLCKE